MSDLRELVEFRLTEAQSSLKEAQVLANQGLYRGSINRCYYSMFYAALALLATKNLGASKHSGVISIFNQEFVKTEIFPKELARNLVTAFDIRNKTDYRDFVEIDPEQAKALLESAREFVTKIEELTKEL